jgi:hypothetical protein
MPIPANVEPAWNGLIREVIDVHSLWGIYRALFGHTEERIKLLAQCGNWFFATVDRALLFQIQMILAKCCDPLKSAGKENMTMDRLYSDIAAASAPKPLLDELHSRLEQYKERCVAIRGRRNKFLAHYDYETLAKIPLPSLDRPSRKELREVIEELDRFMNAVSVHYDDAEIDFASFDSTIAAEELLLWLKRGLRHKQLSDEDVLEWDEFRNSAWSMG